MQQVSDSITGAYGKLKIIFYRHILVLNNHLHIYENIFDV